MYIRHTADCLCCAQVALGGASTAGSLPFSARPRAPAGPGASPAGPLAFRAPAVAETAGAAAEEAAASDMLDTPPLNNPEERRAKPRLSGEAQWRSSYGFPQLGHLGVEHLGANEALRGRSCGPGRGDLGPADSPADEPALSRPQPPAWRAQAGARAGLDGEAGGLGAGLLCEEELLPMPSPSQVLGVGGVKTADVLSFSPPDNGWASPPAGGLLLTSGNSPDLWLSRFTPSPR